MTGYDDIVETLQKDGCIDQLPQYMTIRVPQEKAEKAEEVIKVNGGDIYDSYTHDGDVTFSFGMSKETSN